MSTQIPWISPLGINPTEVENWKLELKPGESLTFHVLEKGLLNWSQYQQWAMDFYQLSSLNDEYFREPAPLEFWKLIQSVSNWSPSLLPLEQWDGTIFIGCVEPPSPDLTWSFPVQFVLVSPTSLKMQWQRYNQTSEVVAAPPPLVVLEFSAPNGADEEPQKEEPAEAPEGLSFNIGETKKASLDFDVDVSSGPSTPEEFLNQFRDSDTPPPSINSIFPDEADTTAVINPNLQAEPIDDPTAVSSPSLLLAEEVETPVVEIAVTNMNYDHIQSEDDLMLWAFNEMKKYYDHSMYLKWDGSNFIPYKWNEGWQPLSGVDQLPIKTDTPSMFRIIARTQNSYHGRVMPTPQHEQFFKNWGMSVLPEMSTVIPVKYQGTLHGVILSIGPETSIEARALEHAEKIGGRIQQKLDQILGSKVA